MKILITGASGFVGSAVLRCLLKAGHEVRALIRPGNSRANLRGLEVEIVEGDLTDLASLERAMRGCAALYHVAADYRLWTPRPEALYQNNVAGTRNIMRVAGDAGVKRIIYTSSVATLGLNPDGTPATEDTPATLKDMIGHYKRSKFLAEAAVRQLVEEQGLPVVIVNPSAPVGPGDVKPTPTGRMILDAARGQMPAYVDTGLSIVHVEDVAEGHIRAFERGRIGERYILGGENMSLREILETLALLTGYPPPRIRLSPGVVLPIAYLSEAWARLARGGEPRVTVDGVRMSRKKMFFSSEKAKRELGYSPRPALEALRDAVEWFRANSAIS